ncbi:caspase domain-containing protein [Fodinibius sp.]|uniref:caspase family protein n=1 Tax=Fodinibius sp. TaxID=1872440 RepID=UPI0035620B1E
MTKRALTVGINNYSILDPSGGTNLNACVDDARSIYHLLNDSFGFSQIYHLEDLKASRDNILSTLRHLIRISEAGDTVCFYFSGHGSRLRADLSKADCDQYYEALVPASGAWITDRDLLSISEDLYPDAVNFTIITDACNSGGLHVADTALKCRTPEFASDLIETIVNFLTTLIPCGICAENIDQLSNNVSNVREENGTIDLDPDPNKTLIPATKSTLLSACHYNELSWESSRIGHGLFTQAILDSVNQSNMQISYHDFVTQLQSNVADKISTIINPSRPGVTQTPQLFGQRNRMGENFLEGWIHTPANP